MKLLPLTDTGSEVIEKLFANYPFRCRKSPQAASLLTGWLALSVAPSCFLGWAAGPPGKIAIRWKAPWPMAFGGTYPMGSD